MVDQNALKSIEDLHRLKSEGIITDEDYEKAKERLLFGAQPRKFAPAATAVTGTSTAPALNPELTEHLRWIVMPLKRYADFTGRSSRREFWMFQLVFLAIFVVAMIGGADLLFGAEGRGVLGIVTVMLTALALLGLVVPLLAVEARRFRDQDRSHWLVLINLVPYVGGLVVLVFMLIEGTPGDNQYGPDPRAE